MHEPLVCKAEKRALAVMPIDEEEVLESGYVHMVSSLCTNSLFS